MVRFSFLPLFAFHHVLISDSHCHILEYGASRQIPLSEGKTVESKSLSRRHQIFLLCLPLSIRNCVVRERLYPGQPGSGEEQITRHRGVGMGPRIMGC